jgi:UDP-GlcNAc:undecaprenyl-phosphate/decaprenyl-phosphate GlcNAc-1-phosphate transferase
VLFRSVLLFFVALKDDLISTGPKIRLFYQFIIAFIIVVIGQVYFCQIPFFQAENVLAKILNMIASLIFIVALINAVNFIDGIDGLAGTISLFIFAVFGFVFYQYGELSYAFISLAIAGSTLGFLLFNLHPAKIFMGDIGSMLLGVFMAVFAIKLSNMESLRLGLIPIRNPNTLALSLLIIPIMDMVTVISARIHLKLSPFHADKRHTHHRLLALGLSQQAATLTLLGFNILVVVFAMLASCINGLLATLIVIIMAAAFEFILIKKYRKKMGTASL